MTFIYYGLYVVYKNIFSEKYPVVYIAGLISISLAFIFTAAQLVFYSCWNVYISSVFSLIIYLVVYRYLDPRQNKIIEYMSTKSISIKILAIFISFSFIFLGFWSFLGNGYVQIREYIYN